MGGMASILRRSTNRATALVISSVGCLELASLRDWFTVFWLLTFVISVFRLSSGQNGQSRPEVRGTVRWVESGFVARTRLILVLVPTHESRNTLHGRKVVWFQRKACRRVAERCVSRVEVCLPSQRSSSPVQLDRLLLVMLITCDGSVGPCPWPRP